jgi:hypothetical protein
LRPAQATGERAQIFGPVQAQGPPKGRCAILGFEVATLIVAGSDAVLRQIGGQSVFGFYGPKDDGTLDQGRLFRICLISSSSQTAAKTPMATRAKRRSKNIVSILSHPYA